jgi:galactose-1-phosphate uridylyltransferase
MVHCKNARDSPGWALRVFPNKFSPLTGEDGMEQETEVLFDKILGIGTHQIVIVSPTTIQKYNFYIKD